MSIGQVKNKEIRRSLRGLLDRQIKSSTRAKLLSKIYQQLSLSDVDHVEQLLYSSSIFSHLDLTDAPQQRAIFYNSSDSISFAPLDVATSVLQRRIHKSSSELALGLDALSELNAAICTKDSTKITESIVNARTSGAESFSLYRKIVAAHSLLTTAEVDAGELQSEINAYGVSRRNPSAILTADTIGWQYDLLNLRRAVIPSTSIKSGAPQWQRIADWLLYPIRQSRTQFYSALHTHWQISLLDAAYTYLSHQQNGKFLSEAFVPDLVLPRNVEDAWQKLVASSSLVAEQLSEDDAHPDFVIFRTAPAFLEDPRLFRVRAVGDAFLQRAEGGRILAPSLSDFLSKTFAETTSFSNLLSETFRIQWADISGETAGRTFFRTMAFIHLVSKGSNFIEQEPDAVVELMGKTRELARLVPKENLRQLLTSQNHPITQLMLLFLLIIDKPRTLDSFRFRSQLQSVVSSLFKGEIIFFLRYFDKLAPSATSTIINALDESTLSQMPRLIDRGENVYRVRADVMEWYGVTHEDEVSLERASQLRLDRKLQSIRGQINDARLSVDSQRFYDWLADSHLQKLSTSVRDGSFKLPDFTTFKGAAMSGVEAVMAHRDPGYVALLELAEIFKAFCADTNFGVSSFLGRRIRHGTLRGTLMGAVEDFETSAVGLELLAKPSIAETYETWRTRYEAKVDAFEKGLYFKSEQNVDGILSARVDSQFKFDILLTAFNALRKQFGEDGHFNNLPQLVESYCWLLLSSELERLQSLLANWRMDWGVIPPRGPIIGVYREEDGEYNDLAREVNTSTDRAFHSVMSWFKKPSSLIPEATLPEIIDVTILEAKDEFRLFDPKVDRISLCEENLVGAVYYHAYDALNIVVKNAAKHGDPRGPLTLKASVSQFRGAKVLDIAVTSLLPAGTAQENVEREINYRRSLGPDAADSFQGKSGIRKLMKMLSEGKIFSWFPVVENNSVTIKLQFLLSGVLRA